MQTSHHGVRPLAALLAGALTISVAWPVAAGAPEAVTIVSDVADVQGGPTLGSFTTSGGAADSGAICPAGSFEDTGIRFAGGSPGRGIVRMQIHRTFTCDDDSGTFDVRMRTEADVATGIETISWVVAGGSGDYASLRGSGLGSTVPRPGGTTTTALGTLH